MQKIRILGTKSRICFPVIGWLNMLVEWSKQSHVAIHDIESEMVIHARFNEIIKEPFSEFIKKNYIVDTHVLELLPIEHICLESFTNRFIGKQKGYWKSWFGAGLSQLLRTITGGRVKIDNPTPGGFTCSWFVYVAMIMSGGMLSEIFYKNKPVDDEAALGTKDIMFLAKKFVDSRRDDMLISDYE